MAPWGWILVWSETCGGERILYDFNVFFNKYVHELVTIDTDFIDARFNYGKMLYTLCETKKTQVKIVIPVKIINILYDGACITGININFCR